MWLSVYTYIFGIFYFFSMKNLFFIIFIFLFFSFCFLWSIKFPQQKINPSEAGIGDNKLSVELYDKECLKCQDILRFLNNSEEKAEL